MNRVILKDILGVQRFGIQAERWERTPNADIHFLAYKLHGSTLHESDGRLLPFEKDMVMVANKEDHYRVLHHDPSLDGPRGGCLSVHFTTATPFDMHLAVYRCANQPQIKSGFFQMLDSWNQYQLYKDPASEYACIASFYAVLSQIARLAEPPTCEADDRLARAKAYIERNYANSTLSVAEMAASADLGSRRFATLFQARYHQSPGKFLTSCRISAAQRLLRQENLSIAQIAALTGYSGASYFIRVFRQETGCSPAAYRKACSDQ